ncbi:MAG: serine protease [Wenzhouxiangella sp.]|nr:MAG: serine protease [Wenzhouxiangella sp.]
MSKEKSLSGKTVSLVLGSGGARGLAHIGVIRVLEEAGVRIEAIAGSSMGALVGGIHAAGKLQAYEDWICGLEQSDVLALVDWTFAGGGLIKGRKIIGKLEELVGSTNIEDLDIDFTAVAVDIDHGREVWLDRGSLFDAIRASIAIPGLFTPHRYRNRTLVDGGLLNPIPVAPTLRCMSDLTVVVDVNGPPSRHLKALVSGDAEKSTDESEPGVWDKFKEFMDSFSSDSQPRDTQPGLLAVMMRSLDTMEAAITRQHLAIFQPDLVVRVPKNACMVHEFHRAREVIDLGARLARKAIEDNGKGYEDA